MTDQFPKFQEIDEEILTLDYGFEEQTKEEKTTFQLKPFQISDFPIEQNLVSFAINDHSILLTTDKRKIFRWRFNDDEGCVELPIKTDNEGDITDQIMKLSGQVTKQIGGAVLNTVSKVTKPLFNASLMKRSRRKDSEEIRLDCIFLEPKGNHYIVASNSGDLFHACRDEMEVRQLQGIEYENVRFFIWGDCSLYSFQNCIIVGSNNKVYSYNLTYNNDKLLHTESISKSLFQINETEKIKDLQKIIKNSIYTILIMTDKFIYILQGTKDIKRLFQKYTESPDLLLKSKIQLKEKSYNPKMFVTPTQILWTNGPNILLSALDGQVENQTFQNYKKLKNFKRNSQEEVKLEQLYGIGLTKFHYYLLTFDALTVINLLTMTVVAYFEININTSGKALGMLYDQGTQCFWIWCTSSIQRIDVEFEDQDAWEMLLELKQYEQAIQVTQKYDNPIFSQISGKYADILFNQALQLDPYKMDGNEVLKNENVNDNQFMRARHVRKTIEIIEFKSEAIQASPEVVQIKSDLYQKAALYYFCSNKPYEEVILQYEMGEIQYSRDGFIENYLKPLVELVSGDLKQVIFKKILELLLLTINNQGIIKRFLETYKEDLEVDSVVPILKAHGLAYLETYFIELKQDHKTVVQNLLIQEDYKSVQEKLSQLNDNELLTNLVYKYSYVIMKYNTQQTLDLFKKIEYLNAQKMLSILLDIPPKSKELAVQFMQYCIFVKPRKITEINFNNLYISYLADLRKVDQIMYYINEQITQSENGEKYKFDLNYAQQLFLKKQLLQPYAYILQMLGDYENAIRKAIEIDLVEDAKLIALKCDDTNKQRQLWILQMRLLLDKGGKYVKQIVQLTREIPLIKAEDILPYLTENIKLDDFKEEICETLEEYHDQVEKQQNELEGYIKSLENLNKLLIQTSNRYIFVSQKTKCENCFRKLLQEDYIIFECTHGFHKECITQYIKQNPETLDQKLYQTVMYLENQIQVIEQSQSHRNNQKQEESIFGFFSASNQVNLNIQKNQKQEQLQKLQQELNEITSKDCPVCGSFIIDQILLPLDNDEYLEESWFI